MSDLVMLGKEVRKMEERDEPFCLDCIPGLGPLDSECPVCETKLAWASEACIKVREKGGGIKVIKVRVCPECYSKFFS